MKEVFKDPILFLIALSIAAECTSLVTPIISALVFTITIVLIFLRDGIKPFWSRSVALFLSFAAIVILYSAFEKGTLSNETLRMRLFSFVSIFSVFIISNHIKTLNNGQVRSLMVVSIVALLFSVVGTTFVSFINPMAIRMYGFGEVEGFEIDIASRYRAMGMMSYPLAHAMPMVAMAFSVLFCFSKNKYLKILSLVILVLILRLLFIMTITTALLLTVIGVTLVFASYFSRGRTVVALFIVVGILALFFLTGISSIFLDFSNRTNVDIAAKLTDTFTAVQTGIGEGQFGYRIELYKASFRTFLSNPLFGWGSDNGSRRFIGEHSYVLDYLAYYGLFALLLFGSWWNEYKSLKSHLSRSLLNYYYYTFIPMGGMVVLKASSVCGTLPFMALIIMQLFFLYINSFNEFA